MKSMRSFLRWKGAGGVSKCSVLSVLLLFLPYFPLLSSGKIQWKDVDFFSMFRFVLAPQEGSVFQAGVMLRFSQVLYRSEFLLKSAFRKRNTLSSSSLPGEFSPLASPPSHGNNAESKPQKPLREEKRSKTFSDPTGSRDEARIHPPRSRGRAQGQHLSLRCSGILARLRPAGKLSRGRRHLAVRRGERAWLSLASKRAAIAARSHGTPAKCKRSLPVGNQPPASACPLGCRTAAPRAQGLDANQPLDYVALFYAAFGS